MVADRYADGRLVQDCWADLVLGVSTRRLGICSVASNYRMLLPINYCCLWEKKKKKIQVPPLWGGGGCIAVGGRLRVEPGEAGLEGGGMGVGSAQEENR